jgi:16S rRNA (cytosine967-C5)-methyltransferase
MSEPGNQPNKRHVKGNSKPSSRPRPKRMLTARELAMDVLTRVDQDQAYSNLLLNQALQANSLDRPDAALATELVYGSIQRLNTIDYFLSGFVPKGLNKLEPWVRSLLRLSLYQLLYLDRIPAHAAVNEAVDIAKRKGHSGISGMVNAILRNALRQQLQLVIPNDMEPVRRMALTYSHPEWLVRRWLMQYGEDTTEKICAANNEPPKISVRVNTMRLSRDSFLEKLLTQGIDARPSELSADGVIVTGAGNMAHSSWYSEGLISIQDESSMLVARALDPEPGMLVLDCCAAPGGKTTHIAELMNDRGKIWASELHEHKRRLIDDQARRLKLDSIESITEDARRLAERFAKGSFDRILLDAPCSGLGVIRRKPDLKWVKQGQDIEGISELQLELLNSISSLLKPGGVLVYSTCTIEWNENERVIERFLHNNGDQFELSSQAAQPAMRTILPYEYGSDGFFIARLSRRS